MQIMRGLSASELCELACVSLSCACRVRCCDCVVPCCRASVPRFAACRRCVRCAAVVCCRAVPPRCCERVLRCARVMYTIVRMIGWWFSSVGARCWQRAGSHSFDAMDYRQRARRGCSDRRGLRSKTRRGTLRVQRKTRRSRWLKVSAGLLVLTARLFILTVPSAPARV